MSNIKNSNELTVQEMKASDIEKIVDYFIDSDIEFLEGMGAAKSKLPQRKEWISKLQAELTKAYKDKEFYYIVWLFNEHAIGHSNINNIKFGESATTHLHLWKNDTRRNGLGLDFLRMTLPYYFRNFELKKLICEPYSQNIAPNKVLRKLNFQFIKTYETSPGLINFHQTVNRYEMKENNQKH